MIARLTCLVVLAIYPAAFGQTALPSAESCVGCHAAETKLHERSRMAHAMTSALQSAFAQNLPDRPLRESGDGYSFLYRRTLSGIEVTAERGTDTATGLIEWVLGAGAQGQTPLVETSGGVAEARVSYFPQMHRYGITIGQNAGASPNALSALGLKQSTHELQACLGCHSSAITRDLQPVVPGVQCQRCHLGADQHAHDTSHRPLNPGKLSAGAQVRFCGNCHRFQAPTSETALENVRFQPLRLMKSQCFIKSGRLACTTCHPAHQDAVRNRPAFYNEKCLGCHGSPAAHSDARQTGDCIGCHMPYVQIHPALRFTDHYIRVVKSGDLPADAIRRRGTGS